MNQTGESNKDSAGTPAHLFFFFTQGGKSNVIVDAADIRGNSIKYEESLRCDEGKLKAVG